MANNIESALSLFQQGRLEEAQSILEKIQQSKKPSAISFFLSGVIFTQEGFVADAVNSFNKAIKIQPHYPEALNNLGVVLEMGDQLDAAKKSYKKAISQKKDYANAYYNLANIQKTQSNLADAIENYRLALKYNPKYFNAMNNLALIHQDQHNFSEAEKLFTKSLSLNPDDIETKNNLAYNYTCQYRFDEAESIYEHILQQKPNYAPTLLNVGILMRTLDKKDISRKILIDLVNLQEYQERANNNMAHLELGDGNFELGWQYYRYRPSARQLPFSSPEKLPDDLNHCSMLLYKDQGIGDEIFFARYIPELQRRNIKLSYFTDSKIKGLFQQRFPNIDIFDTTPKATEIESYDVVASLGDIPRLLYQKGYTDIPSPLDLSPQEINIKHVRATLPNNGKKNIAVTWEAGVLGHNQLYKKVDPELFGKYFRNIEANIIVIQRNPNKRDIAAFEKELKRKCFNFSYLNDNLDDMLAFLSLVDQYYCVSNTNIHLMSALDREFHVFVPFPAEWRWNKIDDCLPWYPNGIANYQSANGDWEVN